MKIQIPLFLLYTILTLGLTSILTTDGAAQDSGMETLDRLWVEAMTFEELFRHLNTNGVTGEKDEIQLSKEEISTEINKLFDILDQTVTETTKNYDKQIPEVPSDAPDGETRYLEIDCASGKMKFALVTDNMSLVERLLLDKCKISDYELSGEFHRSYLKLSGNKPSPAVSSATIAVRAGSYEALAYAQKSVQDISNRFKFKQAGKTYYCLNKPGKDCLKIETVDQYWKIIE